MLKEEYNKNRPRTECPNCGKLITNACFNYINPILSHQSSALRAEISRT